MRKLKKTKKFTEMSANQICRRFGKLYVYCNNMVMCVNTRTVFRLCLSKAIFSSYRFPQSRHLSLSVKLCSYPSYRPPGKYRKWKKPAEAGEVEEAKTADEALDQFIERSFHLPCSGFQVFVIQPYIKWGAQKKRNTTPQLQLLEAVTLIKTLRDWSVVQQQIISLQSIHGRTVFRSGVLGNLREIIFKTPKITAVFISINTLTVQQQIELEQIFQVPVFDRYSIILQIFKEHAKTREAKLQLQLAQLPYLWTVIRGLNSGINEKLEIPIHILGGAGPKLLSDRREVFKVREAKLKKEILEIRNQRAMLRNKREKKEIPVVAVIGYTNAGKTSLIKALTGKESLEPQDYLFATLDVTCHIGVLPSGLEAYFIDTLGFINDIPTYLIESFLATLEDAALANVIVHVRDISHPDTVAQNDKVNEVLKMLSISKDTMDNIITVGNKIDLVDKNHLKNYEDMVFVSATTMTGINILRAEIEKKVLLLSDKIQIIIRVKSGSPEYSWLYEWSTVVKERPDDKDNNYIFIETIISSSRLAKFKHDFIKNFKR